MERIGISERIGIDIRTSLLEQMREKIRFLNFILTKKYNNIFVQMLFDEKCIAIDVNSQEEFCNINISSYNSYSKVH